MTYQIGQFRKFVAAGVGAAAMIATELLSLGDVISSDIGRWLTVVVAVATALGVYGVPNEPTPKQIEKASETGDARMRDEIEAIKSDPKGYYEGLRSSRDDAPMVADLAVVERILKG